MLTIAATIAAPNDSCSAAATRGSIAMRQNSVQPSGADENASPASGISTISDRYAIVYPRLRPKPGRTLRRRQRKVCAASGADAVMPYLAG